MRAKERNPKQTHITWKELLASDMCLNRIYFHSFFRPLGTQYNFTYNCSFFFLEIAFFSSETSFGCDVTSLGSFVQLSMSSSSWAMFKQCYSILRINSASESFEFLILLEFIVATMNFHLFILCWILLQHWNNCAKMMRRYWCLKRGKFNISTFKSKDRKKFQWISLLQEKLWSELTELFFMNFFISKSQLEEVQLVLQWGCNCIQFLLIQFIKWINSNKDFMHFLMRWKVTRLNVIFPCWHFSRYSEATRREDPQSGVAARRRPSLRGQLREQRLATQLHHHMVQGKAAAEASQSELCLHGCWELNSVVVLSAVPTLSSANCTASTASVLSDIVK